MNKSPDAFRTITEVAEWLDTPAHVLRFWESRFSQIKPVKRAGGRRYYRPSDMLLLGGIKKLLHDDGITIKAVQNLLREQGVPHVQSLSQPVSIQVAIKKKSQEAASGIGEEQQPDPVKVPETESASPLAERISQAVTSPSVVVKQPTDQPPATSEGKPETNLEKMIKQAISTDQPVETAPDNDVEDISEQTAQDSAASAYSKMIKLPTRLKPAAEITAKDIQDIEALYYSLKMVRNNMKRTGAGR